jgi:Flp pilus assembly protein TadD
MALIAFIGDHQVRCLRTLFDRTLGVSTGQKTVHVDPFAGVSDDHRRQIEDADTLVVQSALPPPEPEMDLDKLNPGAARFLVPRVTGDFLWPFGGQPHIRSFATGQIPGGVFTSEFGDAYLNRAMGDELGIETVVRAYRDLDVAARVDLDLYLRLFIEQQKHLDPDAVYGIGEFVMRHFRTEPLFSSPSRPNARVIGHLAGVLFRRMGLGDDRATKIEQSDEMGSDAELPIHPSVARHFDLKWLKHNHIYMFLWNQRVSFEEYARRYVIYRFDTNLEEGLYLSQTTNKQRAVEKLGPALAKSPGSACGHFAMCAALARLGRVQEALEHISRAIEIEPDDAQLRSAFGLLLSQCGLPDDAERAFRTAVALEPLAPGCHYELGRFLADRGDFSDAELPLKKANELAPREPSYQSALTVLYAKMGKLAEALASAVKESELHPLNPHPHAFVGQMLAARGDFQDAERSLRAALALEPGIAAFHDQLGQILWRQGRFEEATTEAEIAVALAPAVTAFGNRLSAMRAAGDRDSGEC